MGAIRKSCDKSIELGNVWLSRTCLHWLYEIVFVDGPHILLPVDLGGSPSQYGAAEAEASDPALTPRAWWKANEDRTRYHGIDTSITYLRDILKADRYDVRNF